MRVPHYRNGSCRSLGAMLSLVKILLHLISLPKILRQGQECKLIEVFDTIPKFEPEIEGVKKHFIECTCLTVRKKEKSRQVLAHKRGRKWQIDGHHVEYDVLQPSRMMDVLNSAQ